MESACVDAPAWYANFIFVHSFVFVFVDHSFLSSPFVSRSRSLLSTSHRRCPLFKIVAATFACHRSCRFSCSSHSSSPRRFPRFHFVSCCLLFAFVSRFAHTDHSSSLQHLRPRLCAVCVRSDGQRTLGRVHGAGRESREMDRRSRGMGGSPMIVLSTTVSSPSKCVCITHLASYPAAVSRFLHEWTENTLNSVLSDCDLSMVFAGGSA